MNIDLNSILETFENIPFTIKTYISNIPEDRLDIQRSEEAWTIREHLYHIAGVQGMLYSRLEKMAHDPAPAIEPFFPEKEIENSQLFDSVEEAFLQYEKERKRQITLIRSIKRKEMEKEASHPEYERYSIPLLINHMIFHEYWHMYRIEELWLTREEYFR